MKRLPVIAAAVLWCSVAFAQNPPGVGNMTPNSGGTGSGGGVTSIATTCGVSGGTITTTGTISGQTTPNPQTGANYPITTANCGQQVNLSNASPQTPTLPSPPASGTFFVTVCNQGAGIQTITPSAGLIGGNASYALPGGTAAAPVCIDIVSDGTNYQISQLYTSNAALLNAGTLAAARMPALTGDCTTSAGAVATSCSQPLPGYVATDWYLPFPPATAATGATFTANTIYCRFHYFPQEVTIGTVGVNVQTVSTSGNIQIALYTNSSGLPGSLITNTGSISTITTTGMKSGALGANVQVGPGSTNGKNIWFCVNSDNATHIMIAYSTSFPVMGAYMGAASQAGLMPGAGSTSVDNISCTASCNGSAGAFGTWPASLGGSTWSTNLTTSRFPVIPFAVVSSP